VAGSLFVDNRANEGGGAIFFVSDDRTGTMAIRNSTLERNPNDRFHTPGLPGIYFLGARTPTITESLVR
jgi:predicted outer membrane repeat protein